MKKIKYFLVLLFGLFIRINVNANEINKIAMDIYINENGMAHVKETWNANLDQGTEGYKPYYNLGEATITNFKVSMGGQKFETLSAWDVDASFSGKAYKSGINEISSGLELCWGISKYGKNTYILEYDINNFVVALNDADMIYWSLIPYELEQRLENYYIKIYSDFKYEDTLDVWGYGNYGGYAYVYDGYIEISNEQGLDASEYVVALIKFPQGTFKTDYQISEDFDYYYQMAEEGSTSYIDNGEDDYWNDASTGDIISGIIGFIVGTGLFMVLPIWLFAKSFKNGSWGTYGNKKLLFENGTRKLARDVNYFRDIPCNQDIFKAYWVAGNYSLMKQKTDFLGALLLKWLKEDRIQNVTVQSKFLKKDVNALKFINKDGLTGPELEMYDYMELASKDGVLEPNEFKNWSSRNYAKVLNWFDKVIDATTENYVTEGGITKEVRKKIFENTYYIIGPGIQEEATRMKGLKKFLKDFTIIHEREPIEVKLWEYYLMYAQIFGIAKKVAAEFKKLYPDVISDQYYNNMIFIHTFSNSGVGAASAAQSRAQSYSSGGGGFSSGGGGGGSFGGGGGGGGFR